MRFDPLKMKNWEIAYEAEKNMKTVYQLGEELGLTEELLPYGHYIAKIDYQRVFERLKDRVNGKYIDITAITPTPLGEGKTTTLIGLVQGLGKRGKKVIGTIRQPSSGPIFNIKGGSAGGGLSQVIPLDKFSLGLTGDINAVMNAHNLAMVAITARMQHEANYSDEILAKKGLKRLNIDPKRVEMGWVIDFCAQALRHIVIGLGGKMDGYPMESKFYISGASEVMAILAIAKNLKDLRKRIGKIVVAFDKYGNPITTEDLEVAGAMTALLVDALNPNLVQTIEGQPVLVHTGPFGNIALGQSSVIADYIALKLGEYVITESGFAADIGFEKFWNVKCRISGLIPDAVVIVATIRALKCHGGAPVPKPGSSIPKEYFEENLKWIKKGCENLFHCINIVRKSGINPVVCINKFYTDTKKELDFVKKFCEDLGVRVAFSDHWLKGGEGALELADTVIDASKETSQFKFLYELDEPVKERIEKIAKEIYGAEGVIYSSAAEEKIKLIERNEELKKMPICIAKTHLSLSDDPGKKGVPKKWQLRIRNVLIYKGSGFIVPVAGEIKLMPGTGSDPAYRRIDVDLDTGKVKGLF
ncbi:MAG: formate--tetrahydrofolate ligase [Thermodesulfobacteriota bacterium]|nr:MAG: formate--tetrahydrofolate ligase [Thermodesulfobacteriota bacterium]